MALGMAMNGAAGTTYDEMRAALAFGSASETEIGESYKSLITLLRGLDPSVSFSIANSIWYRAGFPFKQSFLDAGRTWFDAQVSPLDFTNPSAVKTINDWVSASTAGKIPTILDKIEDDQVMFLINAIYFKGSWRTKFDASRTVDAPFHGVGGDQPAKLMHRDGQIRHLRTADFEAVDLPYGNGAYSMTVVLIPDLQSLGMRAAFVDGGADFTRMSTLGSQLFISVVKQKTYVDVNEEGTEAAAVTNVGISLTSAPVRIIFRVDRPFVFVLRERLSGTVLFMGKIVRMP